MYFLNDPISFFFQPDEQESMDDINMGSSRSDDFSFFSFDHDELWERDRINSANLFHSKSLGLESAKSQKVNSDSRNYKYNC